MSKRLSSPAASYSHDDAHPSKRARPQSPPSDGASTSVPKPVSLHQWLHPTLPPPLKTHSPPLHEASSTFLSYTISFEPPTHVSSIASLEKEIRRIVRELDVVSEVGELVLKADEGAFANGEGRAPGRNKFSGRERAREPDHRMWAVRTLGLKEGKDGTGGEGDYQLLEAMQDDNEKYGGQTIMRVLQENNAVDVLTICCRWYGGDMIGPFRFQHITTTALTSLRSTVKSIGLRDLRTSLEILDEDISALRSSLPPSVPVEASKDKDNSDPVASQPGTQGSNGIAIGSSNGTVVPKVKYDEIQDEAKLQRLITARERTKAALEKKLAGPGPGPGP